MDDTRIGQSSMGNKRIRALKKLSFKHSKLQLQFYNELYELEKKYEEMCSHLYQKRYMIVSGQLIPSDEDASLSDVEYSTDEDSVEEWEDFKNLEIGDSFATEMLAIKGIPAFWLFVLKRSPLLAGLIKNYDEPVLQHLTDIKSKLNKSGPMGFVLEFHFEKNNFFSNEILTKEYEMKNSIDEANCFSYEGPEVVKCIGCEILWYPEKDVINRTVRHTQYDDEVACVVEKKVERDSFFNFFKPPVTDETNIDDVDILESLYVDYKQGIFVRDYVVPKAVLLFTGDNFFNESDFSITSEDSHS